MKRSAVSFDRSVTFPLHRCKILIFAGFVLGMGLSSVSAQTVIRLPRHDWTVEVGGHKYGLVEYGPMETIPPRSGCTVMTWGTHQRSVNLNIFVVAAVPMVVLAFIGFLATRILIRLGEGSSSRETETAVDGPT
jgi:hypothetical protein